MKQFYNNKIIKEQCDLKLTFTDENIFKENN
jgi:hypothetical protein